MRFDKEPPSKKNLHFVLLASILLSSVCIVFYNALSFHSNNVRITPLSEQRHAFKNILSLNENIKTILLWNSFFGEKHFKFGVGKSAFEDAACPVTNCAIWDQEDGNTDLPHDSFDAVVFHVIDIFYGMLRDEIPRVRRPNQLYAFMLLESPATRRLNLLLYKELFNLTMTYRRDSDIYSPYGWIASKNKTTDTVQTMYPSKFPTEWMVPSYEAMVIPRPWTLSTKKKAVAWFVTKCHAPSKREVYVKELSRYVEIDIYGRCGTFNCTRESSVKCYQMMEDTYYFYLSFENSLCTDYVTEKLFYVLNYNVIPIVYGGANYETIVPPMSYINIEDYSSPQELAEYLNYLVNTPSEYRKYFWWKTHYQVISNSYAVMFCSLCEILNSESQRRRVYENIDSWWNAANACHRPEDFTTNRMHSKIANLGNDPLGKSGYTLGDRA